MKRRARQGKDSGARSAARPGNDFLTTLRAVADLLPDPAFAIDLEGAVILWNRAMEDLTGVSARDMIGRSGYAYAVPLYDVPRPMLVDLLLSPDAVYEGRYDVIRRENDTLTAEGAVTIAGVRHYLWGKAAKLVDHRGNIIGVIETLRDTTDRKAAEDALRLSEARYKDIFLNVSDLLFIHDLNGRFIETNLAAKKETGYTDEDLSHMSVQDILPERHRYRFVNYMHNVLEKGSDEGFFTIVAKDGSERIVEYRNSLVRDEKGVPIAVRGSARDITRRLRLQKQLRRERDIIATIIDTSPAFIDTIDMSGRVLMMNKAMLDALGYTPVEILGADYAETFLPEDEREAFASVVHEMVSTKRPVVHEKRILRKNGEAVLVQWHSRVVTRADGSPEFLFGVGIDITEHRRAEQERELADARLVQAQKLEAIGTLAGGIAHDFNNILVAIIGYSELAMEDLPEASRARESIAEVLKAGYRARELVRQILTFSRRTQAECTTVHIPSIVKEAVKLLRSSIPSTIAIVESIDPSVPHILADPTQIHQVILNLSTNAYHAMSPSGGTLTIRVDCVDVDDGMASEHPDLKTGPHVRISVRDTGCGMDKATMSRIFDPFFTTKDPTKGTGLGLATVHGIVSSLGGAVLVTSSPGKGSTFDVYLPATPATVHAQQDTTPDIPAGNGQRILVVDDEPSILEIAASMLEQLGYRCITRASSTEAFELFRSDPACIDLVITDQTMPGMTGADLARAMLALRPDMPVILMTGFSEVMGRDEALSLGIREFIEKPFSMGDLARKVSFCLTSRG